MVNTITATGATPTVKAAGIGAVSPVSHALMEDVTLEMTIPSGSFANNLQHHVDVISELYISHAVDLFVVTLFTMENLIYRA